MSIVSLKIKIKSLAAEAAMIRHEERKQLSSGRWLRDKARFVDMEAPYAEYNSLRDHRLGLRYIQRIAQLAYAFLRNVPYRTVEQRVVEADSEYLRGTGEAGFKYPKFDDIFKEAQKFSGIEIRVLQQRFAQWRQEAQLDKPGVAPPKVARVKVPYDGTTPGKSKRRRKAA